MSVYFDDPIHRTLQTPYYQIAHDMNPAWFLFFTMDWAFVHGLIPNADCKLWVTLLDTETGKQAVDKSGFCSCDNRKNWLFGIALFDDNWKEPELCCLQPYMYQDHFCACHRKTDFYRADQNMNGQSFPDDVECEGNRYKVVSIASPHAPDVVLYSETMSEQELLAKLKS